MSKTDLNELYRALHRLNRQMYRAYHRGGHGRGGVHRGQANLLLLILQNDGANQRDLAELLDVRPSSMTEMLARLEQSNLVVRKQDEKDQRVMHIFLTEEGKAVAEKIAESKDDVAGSFFSALADDEQEQLLSLINKLCAGLGAAEDSCDDACHRHGPGHHGRHRHGLHHDHHDHEHHDCGHHHHDDDRHHDHEDHDRRHHHHGHHDR